MVTGTCYVVARPLNAALRIRREEREMAYGQSKAETIRRRRDRLKEQPQERSLIAGAGSTRSRPRWACLTSFRCRNSKLRTNLLQEHDRTWPLPIVAKASAWFSNAASTLLSWESMAPDGASASWKTIIHRPGLPPLRAGLGQWRSDRRKIRNAISEEKAKQGSAR